MSVETLPSGPAVLFQVILLHEIMRATIVLRACAMPFFVSFQLFVPCRVSDRCFRVGEKSPLPPHATTRPRSPSTGFSGRIEKRVCSFYVCCFSVHDVPFRGRGATFNLTEFQTSWSKFNRPSNYPLTNRTPRKFRQTHRQLVAQIIVIRFVSHYSRRSHCRLVRLKSKWFM